MYIRRPGSFETSTFVLCPLSSNPVAAGAVAVSVGATSPGVEIAGDRPPEVEHEDDDENIGGDDSGDDEDDDEEDDENEEQDDDEDEEESPR